MAFSGDNHTLAWSWSLLCELSIPWDKILKRCVLECQDLIKLITFNVLSRTSWVKLACLKLQVCGGEEHWILSPLPRSVLTLKHFNLPLFPHHLCTCQYSGKGSQRPQRFTDYTLRTTALKLSLSIVTVFWNTNCILLQKDKHSLGFKHQELDNIMKNWPIWYIFQ